MNRAVIFDMGGVLIRWAPMRLAAQFGLPREEEALLLTEVLQSVEWLQLDRGALPAEAAIGAMEARLPTHLHPCVRQLVLGWWDMVLDPMPGMADLLRQLKAAGFGLYVLSNAALTFRTYFPRIPGADCFDGVYLSAEHHLLKPDPAIYRDFLGTFSLEPAQCFFIDDNPANVEAAILCGMAGTVFCGDDGRLRQALQAAGFSLN